MQVTQKYLDRYRRKFETPEALTSLAPSEVPLSTFEEGGRSIVLDVPPDSGLTEAVSIIHRDDNPDDAESWELDAAKRQTLVFAPGERVGYLFDGLLSLDDVRLWFRHKIGIIEMPPTSQL
jgi:hypothetical protein